MVLVTERSRKFNITNFPAQETFNFSCLERCTMIYTLHNKNRCDNRQNQESSTKINKINLKVTTAERSKIFLKTKSFFNLSLESINWNLIFFRCCFVHSPSWVRRCRLHRVVYSHRLKTSWNYGYECLEFSIWETTIIRLTPAMLSAMRQRKRADKIKRKFIFIMKERTCLSKLLKWNNSDNSDEDWRVETTTFNKALLSAEDEDGGVRKWRNENGKKWISSAL